MGEKRECGKAGVKELEARRHWELVFLCYPGSKHGGRGDLHGIAWACVEAHGRIGGPCG